MKIDQIETTVLEMPYKKPLVTATNNFTVARGLLVKAVTDDGVEGYGYSDLFPRTGETPETARHVIEGVLKPKIIGRDLEELMRIRADIDRTAIHLAASTPGIAPLCELGEFEVITGDPFFGLSVEKGAISVPESEGLGVSLRGF